MCSALASDGRDVTLCAGKPDRKWHGKSPFEQYALRNRFAICQFRIPERFGGRWRYALRVVAKARKIRPDLVYTRCPFSALLASKFGFPTVMEMHSIPNATSQIARQVLPRLVVQRNLLAFVHITKMLQEDFSKQFPECKAEAWVFPDAADPQPELANHSGSVDGSFTVGYMGSLYPGKGIEVILPLAEKCAWAEFVIVGGEPNTVTELRHRSKHLTNITFLGRQNPQDAIREAAKFDVALVPNQVKTESCSGKDIGRWTSPLKVFEYMSLGKPILASRIEVLQEVLSDNVNCLLANPTDVGQWASNLRRLKDDKDLRNRIGSRALKEFNNRYTWDQRAAGILANVLKSKMRRSSNRLSVTASIWK